MKYTQLLVLVLSLVAVSNTVDIDFDDLYYSYEIIPP